jgi:hypothetical protein
VRAAGHCATSIRGRWITPGIMCWVGRANAGRTEMDLKPAVLVTACRAWGAICQRPGAEDGRPYTAVRQIIIQR